MSVKKKKKNLFTFLEKSTAWNALVYIIFPLNQAGFLENLRWAQFGNPWCRIKCLIWLKLVFNFYLKIINVVKAFIVRHTLSKTVNQALNENVCFYKLKISVNLKVMKIAFLSQINMQNLINANQIFSTKIMLH